MAMAGMPSAEMAFEHLQLADMAVIEEVRQLPETAAEREVMQFLVQTFTGQGLERERLTEAALAVLWSHRGDDIEATPIARNGWRLKEGVAMKPYSLGSPRACAGGRLVTVEGVQVVADGDAVQTGRRLRPWRTCWPTNS